MLSVTEEKKTKRPFGFLFIAASILVLVMLGTFLYTQNGAKIQRKDDIVIKETKQDTVQNKTNLIQRSAKVEALEKQVVETEKPIKNNESSNRDHQVVNNNHQGVALNNQKPTVNQNHNDNQSQIIKNKEIEFMLPGDIAIKDIPKISTQREISVVSNKKVKSDETLLADLDKVAKQSTSQKSTLKVDAKSLLTQLDGELDLTFREKVINKVNKNYKEVKVALANRNKE
jgi:hypothetical protein